MTNKYLPHLMKKLWCVFLLLLVLISTSAPRSLAATIVHSPPAKVKSDTLASITLHGWVKNQSGNPIQSAIAVIDRQWSPLGDILTGEDPTH